MAQGSTSALMAGQGSALCLPAVSIPACAPLLLGADELPLRGTETILLVEDQIFVREVTGKILRSAGYSVLMAKSAEEGSHAYGLASAEIGLLVTDVILPGDNGRELARKLRRENPLLRVLLITGYAEQMVKSGSDPEFGRWLAKPFSARTLLQRVREVLDGQGPDRREIASDSTGKNGRAKAKPFMHSCRGG